MEIVLENKAMIVCNDERSDLLVADLHLGFHKDLEALTGAAFPSEHLDIANAIEGIISRYDGIETLWILGDLKHSIGVDIRYNWEIIPHFLERLSDIVEVVLVPGNHDGNIHAVVPRDVRVASTKGEVLYVDGKRVGVIHGHAWPSEDVIRAEIIVMGHNHPVLNIWREVTVGNISVRRRPRQIPVFLKMPLDRSCVERARLGKDVSGISSKATLYILPSFNPLAGGVGINTEDASLRGPLVESGCARVNRAEIFSENGIFLGTMNELRRRIQRKH